MADVFISYAREDEARVRALAGILEEQGLSVWWDQYLFAGDDYRREIDRALGEASAVLVCWSRHAADSAWVRAEAEDARTTGKLVGLAFDDTSVPKPFNTYHVERLTGWRGALRTPAIERLIEALRARNEGRAPSPVPVRRQWATGGAIVAGLVTLVSIVGWFSGMLQPLFILQDISEMRAEVEQVRRELSSLQFELMAKLTARAAARDIAIPDTARSSIAATIAKVLDPAEDRRSEARTALEAGDFEGAAGALVRLAEEQSAAVTMAQASAAETYREAGDLYFATDTEKSIEAYRQAVGLDPGNSIARNQLGHLYRRVGELEQSAAQYRFIIDNPNASGDSEYRYWEGVALSNLGNISKTRGDFDDAQNYYRRALEIQTELGNREEMAIAVGNLGNVALDRGNIDEAESNFLKALAIQEELGEEARAARQLRNLGNAAATRGDGDTADEYFQRALAIFERLGDDAGAADQLTGLGINAFQRSEYTEARDYTERALALHRRLGYKQAIAADLGNLGNIAMLQDDDTAAEAYFSESLSLQRELGSRGGEATLLGALGQLAKRGGDLERAAEYLGQTLAIGEEIGARETVAITLNNLGNIAWLRGDYDAAAGYYQRSLVIHEEMGRRIGVAINTGNLANIAEIQGDLDSSMDMNRDALAILRELGNRHGEALTLGNMGSVARKRGELAEAERHYESALALYQELGTKSGMAVQLNGLGTLARLKGELGQARELHERALGLATESGQQEAIAAAELGLAYLDRDDGRTGLACERLARASAQFGRQETSEAKDTRRLIRELGCPPA